MKTISRNKDFENTGLYNYSDVFCREETVRNLLNHAARNKLEISQYWNNMRRYYDGEHDIRKETNSLYEKHSLPWRASQSTDGYIHVESLIEPEIPDFEFSPRSESQTDKAKQREMITRYILDTNDMLFKNSRNERRLGIYGSAVWKVCWDDNSDFSGDKGDVCIDAPDPSQIYPDPSASDIDSCEYIGYVYKMHKQRAARVFRRDFELRGTCLEDYLRTSAHSEYSGTENDVYDETDTVSITEWWFRQPKDGSMSIKSVYNGKERHMKYTWESGDIGLCIFINGKEIKYIPKYWRNTKCRMLPFVIYNKIASEKSIWGKSELEQIIPLIDAVDREMAYAQLNSAFSSNDIILLEENAVSDDSNPDNSPGAVWKLRPGMTGKVQRLGNLSSASAPIQNACSFWRSLEEATTGNFEANQGKEPTSVTTATGIALLGERAQNRKTLKNIDRNSGFKRLFRLCDMTALEFYGDGRVLRIQGEDSSEKTVYKYSSFCEKNREESYIPYVDVIIHTGKGIGSSPAFTLSALNTLMTMGINKDNYGIVKAYLDEINIPQRAELKAYIDSKFEKEPDTKEDTEEIDKLFDTLLIGKENEQI